MHARAIAIADNDPQISQAVYTNDGEQWRSPGTKPKPGAIATPEFVDAIIQPSNATRPGRRELMDAGGSARGAERSPHHRPGRVPFAGQAG